MNFKITKLVYFIGITILSFCSVSIAQSDIQYDIVLVGGRVIDPETKLDAIKNVGIINSHIAQISSETLRGKEMINLSGLVVAPGFIDLHVHGRTNVEQEYQLHDGVTTALELEWGIEFLKDWYETRKSKAFINYGASVCWPFERYKAFDKYKSKVEELHQIMLKGQSSISDRNSIMSPSFLET